MCQNKLFHCHCHYEKNSSDICTGHAILTQSGVLPQGSDHRECSRSGYTRERFSHL